MTILEDIFKLLYGVTQHYTVYTQKNVPTIIHMHTSTTFTSLETYLTSRSNRTYC